MAALVSALVSVLITSILAPLIFYWLKRRDDDKRRNFDVRYAEYKQYLKALDDMSAGWRVDASAFMEKTKDHLAAILAGAADTDARLQEINRSVFEYTQEFSQSQMRAKGELHGLRLVCSDRLLKLVDEFVALVDQLLNQSLEMLKDVSRYQPGSQPLAEMTALGKRAENLKEQIIRQMRVELGIK